MPINDDFYFKLDYASLYSMNVSDIEIHQFKYQKGDFVFQQLGLKRKIKSIGNHELKESLFDIQSPYGYGGIRLNTDNEEFINESFINYKKYCSEQNIIAEFFTFHPLLPFFNAFASQFDFLVKDRELVCIDLKLSKEDRWANYAPNTRNILRNCEKNLSFSESKDLDAFRELYRLTMNKNNASEFYYFDDEYFENLLSINGCSLVSVSYLDKPISMAFLFHSSEIGHYHLSANNYDQSKLNGNYYLLDKSIDYLKSLKMQKFLLGGGRTNAEDDSLFKFKQKFSNSRIPFHLGGLIFNLDKYKELCNLWLQLNPEKTNNYFLKYRF